MVKSWNPAPAPAGFALQIWQNPAPAGFLKSKSGTALILAQKCNINQDCICHLSVWLVVRGITLRYMTRESIALCAVR